LAFRYLLLTAHYRDKINFTWESLTASQNALHNLREEISSWPDSGSALEQSEQARMTKIGGYYQQFLDAINNDLNTPQALAILWKMVKDKDYSAEQKSMDILAINQILGLKLDAHLGKNEELEIPEVVQELVDQRKKTRVDQDFKKSDELRDEIKKHGFQVLDTVDGQTVKKI